VAKCLDRLDASLLCRFKAGYSNQQVDDWLRRKTWDGRAADVLDGQSERAERLLDPRALLLEQIGPVGVIVGDNDRPGPVFLHVRPLIARSCQRIPMVALEASRLGHPARVIRVDIAKNPPSRPLSTRASLTFAAEALGVESVLVEAPVHFGDEPLFSETC